MFRIVRGTIRPATRRAWDAALDFGHQRLKDIAFERAIEGQLIPVFVGGKLMGFRRKHNDRLLMFMLRHYGQDGEGKRVTVNYFSARASAGGGTGAGAGGAAGGATAEVGTASIRTVTARPAGLDGEQRALRDDRLAGELAAFPGVALDAEAEAAINAALEACAARARDSEALVEQGGDRGAAALAEDPGAAFVRLADDANPYLGVLEPPLGQGDEGLLAAPGEPHWRHAGGDDPRVAIEAAVAEVKRAKRRSNWGKTAGEGKGGETA